MKATKNKHISKSVARNTLFINQNDAAYWLAAENFVKDDEELLTSVSTNALEQKRGSSKERVVPVQDLHSSEEVAKSLPNQSKVLGLSQLRPKKTGLYNSVATHSPMHSKYDQNLLHVPAGSGSNQTNSASCPNTPTGEHSFSSPRRAPPAPHMKMQAKGNDLKSPLSPVSPLPSTLAPSLLPPLDIKSTSLEPSSTYAFNSSPIFQPPHHGHVSTQTISSTGSHSAALVGTAMIASFPSPPQREERARMINYDQIVARKGEKQVEKTVARPHSKPLPPAPFIQSHELEYDSDSESDTQEDFTDYTSHEKNILQASLSTTIVQHRPLCPYANHTDVSTDHCGCRIIPPQKFYQSNDNKLACKSAPDLLDLVANCSQSEEKVRIDDIQIAKNVLYRLSDEINQLKEEGRNHQHPKDGNAPKKTAIRWALPEDGKGETELQYRSGFLSAPVNKALPTRPDEKVLQRSLTPDPSRLIQNQLYPQRNVLVERSVTPGPSYGLAAGMLQASFAPQNLSSSNEVVKPTGHQKENVAIGVDASKKVQSILRPQRSFDMLKSKQSNHPLLQTSPVRAVTPSPPFSAQRRMISTVRSHDRWNGSMNQSAKRNGSPSDFKPPSPSSQMHQWDSPWQNVRSQANSMDNELTRHHRQNSSKSSSSSASSALTSSHGSSNTHASSTDSSGPPIPIWAKLQYKGRPSMGVIHESNLQKNSNAKPERSPVSISSSSPCSPNAPSSIRAPISPRRRKDDMTYLTDAIDPFPLESREPRYQKQASKKGSSSQTPPPLPPPLPAGHRLLDGQTIGSNSFAKVNQSHPFSHFGPPPRMASRSHTNEQDSCGFAL